MTDQTIPADAVREAVTTPEVGLGDRVTFEAFGRRVLGTVTRCDKDGITIREESPYALSAAAPEPQSATTPKDTPMTDQTVPADAVRKIIARYRDAASDRGGMLLDELAALIPGRPTLAEMTEEKRDACRWMQADIKGSPRRAVIIDPYPQRYTARVLWPDGEAAPELASDVTPRPDLPRLEWPANESSEKLARDDDAPKTVALRDAVPPNTLAEGSEWDDADALTLACKQSELDQITVIDCDGDVHVWGAGAGWWEAGWPSYKFAPYTIIHAGRKADQ